MDVRVCLWWSFFFFSCNCIILFHFSRLFYKVGTSFLRSTFGDPWSVMRENLFAFLDSYQLHSLPFLEKCETSIRISLPNTRMKFVFPDNRMVTMAIYSSAIFSQNDCTCYSKKSSEYKFLKVMPLPTSLKLYMKWKTHRIFLSKFVHRE